MLISTIAISILISLFAIAYVVWPVLFPQNSVMLSEDHPLTDLLARKDALLLALKELEFDYHMGKLTQDDFQRLNQRQRHQAMVILRQIEKSTPHNQVLDASLEEEIDLLRQNI